MQKLHKVLLVDDDDIVNSINKVIIKHAKFAEEIVSETIASKAIDYIKDQKSKGTLPDLIFLDINMPEMNGWDFIEEFEKLGLDEDGVRVIMLTSSINPRDENRASLIDGITDFMCKPLSPELLDRIYENYFIAS
ncbi:MAG: response regulator [Bacteroidota bacterium]